ncbi:MAG TPA: beta-propeller fold lactonase family protein [Pyrinomonadaceae bacterium]
MMKARSVAILITLLTAVLAVALQPGAASAQNLKSGAVYVLTNQAGNNAVAAFHRAADGTLTLAGMFPTGGSGDPVAEPGDPPTDPLASQGALILSGNNQLLFAVNAGSNEISVLAVGQKGLTLADKVSSGGVRPISLTLNGNFLYVLNEKGTPNITGFTVSNKGKLTPRAGSTRPLSGGAAADPAEVRFSPDGGLLVVTEKDTNQIDVYTVGANGLASAPVAHSSNGMTPFGFDFDSRGHLIVSEAFGGAPNQAAVSSYTASPSGSLSVVSGSVRDFQTATCWIVIAGGGRYVYTSNTGSGAVSSYRLGANGALALLNSVAASTGPNSFPIDMALDNSSRYLYVHAAGLQSVAAFRVESNGSLTSISVTGGLPFGAQGIAAR